MARPVWTGYLGFGLVSIPVSIYSATQEHEVRFHQFQRDTSDRIRYKRVNERTGREVEYEDIVKGHDVGGGEYVIVEPDELDEIAPGRSRSMEIATFVDLGDIDPLHFQKSYYLGPADDDNASSYALLREALATTDKAAIVSFVMRGKEYLGAVRSADQVLVLETMYFADEVRDAESEIESLPERRRAGKQLTMAVDLVEAMSEAWNAEEFHDTYTERVQQLVEAKRKGDEVVAETAPEATNVTDLFEALQASVDDARARRRDRPASKRRGRTAAKAKARVDRATKAELTKLARDLDIDGRSTMTRDELAEAVRAASAA